MNLEGRTMHYPLNLIWLLKDKLNVLANIAKDINNLFSVKLYVLYNTFAVKLINQVLAFRVYWKTNDPEATFGGISLRQLFWNAFRRRGNLLFYFSLTTVRLQVKLVLFTLSFTCILTLSFVFFKCRPSFSAWCFATYSSSFEASASWSFCLNSRVIWATPFWLIISPSFSLRLTN